MQTNSAVQQNKNVKWSESPLNEYSRRGKGLMWKEFTKEPNSEWKTERVRKDETGESEDGEDDELSCVIGESEAEG